MGSIPSDHGSDAGSLDRLHPNLPRIGDISSAPASPADADAGDSLEVVPADVAAAVACARGNADPVELCVTDLANVLEAARGLCKLAGRIRRFESEGHRIIHAFMAQIVRARGLDDPRSDIEDAAELSPSDLQELAASELARLIDWTAEELSLRLLPRGTTARRWFSYLRKMTPTMLRISGLWSDRGRMSWNPTVGSSCGRGADAFPCVACEVTLLLAARLREECADQRRWTGRVLRWSMESCAGMGQHLGVRWPSGWDESAEQFEARIRYDLAELGKVVWSSELPPDDWRSDLLELDECAELIRASFADPRLAHQVFRLQGQIVMVPLAPNPLLAGQDGASAGHVRRELSDEAVHSLLGHGQSADAWRALVNAAGEPTDLGVLSKDRRKYIARELRDLLGRLHCTQHAKRVESVRGVGYRLIPRQTTA